MKGKKAALSASILTSSIWTEPSDIRVVWVTMLALASKDGKVAASMKKLAELANVPKEVAVQAIQIFSSKDERSRDKDDDGRRIDILPDGFRILNYEKYNEPLKKVKEKPVGTGIVIDYDVVQMVRFEFYKYYETDLSDLRIRRELNPLGREDKHLVSKAFSEYVRQTPVKYFSWNRFRDTWKGWIPKAKGADPRDIFAAIIANPTGYSPAVGSFWTYKDVVAKHGEAAGNAFEKIGGSAKLQSITNDNKKFAELEFIKALT